MLPTKGLRQLERQRQNASYGERAGFSYLCQNGNMRIYQCVVVPICAIPICDVQKYRYPKMLDSQNAKVRKCRNGMR